MKYNYPAESSFALASKLFIALTFFVKGEVSVEVDFVTITGLFPAFFDAALLPVFFLASDISQI